MDYHLRPIELFVSNYLKPKHSLIEKLKKPVIEEVILKISEEIEKIKSNISMSYYAFDTAVTSELFIKNHHRRVTLLINEISRYKLKRNPVSASMTTVYLELRELLSELLKFLENEYGHYMDEQLPITHTLGVDKAMEFSVIISKFPAPFYYSDPLFKIAMEPINSFIQGDKTKYNYRQLKYLNRLIKELDQLQSKIDFGYKVEIINLLICLNFNNNIFFSYLTGQLLQEVHKEETINAQLLKLRFFQKQYRQKMSKYDIAFLPKRRNIQEQVVLWLTEEIKYMESSLELLKSENGAIKAENRKYQLDLSVEQIAILIKLFKDTDILKVHELKSFSNFICEHFSTKKKEIIAESSLYNKIYKYEFENPGKIKSQLIDWLNNLA